MARKGSHRALSGEATLSTAILRPKSDENIICDPDSDYTAFAAASTPAEAAGSASASTVSLPVAAVAAQPRAAAPAPTAPISAPKDESSPPSRGLKGFSFKRLFK